MELRFAGFKCRIATAQRDIPLCKAGYFEIRRRDGLLLHFFEKRQRLLSGHLGLLSVLMLNEG